MNFRPLSFFAFLYFTALSACSAQGTTRITFDGPPVQPTGTQYGVTQYFESGMSFMPIGPSDPGNQFTRNGGGISFYPDDGTAYIQAGFGDSLAFSFENGSLFGLTSVDLAGFSTVVPNFAINFVGYHADGSTITISFSGTGIDFQTYNFGSDWLSGLTRVEIPNYGWSLDNLVVAVPEPSTGALLLVGASALLFRRLRNRK
jgi:hypothetical protein